MKISTGLPIYTLQFVGNEKKTTPQENEGIARRVKRSPSLPNTPKNKPDSKLVFAKDEVRIEPIEDSRKIKTSYSVLDIVRILKNAFKTPVESFADASIQLIEYASNSNLKPETKEVIRSLAKKLSVLDAFSSLHPVGAGRSSLGHLLGIIEADIEGKPISGQELSDAVTDMLNMKFEGETKNTVKEPQGGTANITKFTLKMKEYLPGKKDLQPDNHFVKDPLWLDKNNNRYLKTKDTNNTERYVKVLLEDETITIESQDSSYGSQQNTYSYNPQLGWKEEKYLFESMNNIPASVHIEEVPLSSISQMQGFPGLYYQQTTGNYYIRVGLDSVKSQFVKVLRDGDSFRSEPSPWVDKASLKKGGISQTVFTYDVYSKIWRRSESTSHIFDDLPWGIKSFKEQNKLNIQPLNGHPEIYTTNKNTLLLRTGNLDGKDIYVEGILHLDNSFEIKLPSWYEIPEGASPVAYVFDDMTNRWRIDERIKGGAGNKKEETPGTSNENNASSRAIEPLGKKVRLIDPIQQWFNNHLIPVDSPVKLEAAGNLYLQHQRELGTLKITLDDIAKNYSISNGELKKYIQKNLRKGIDARSIKNDSYVLPDEIKTFLEQNRQNVSVSVPSTLSKLYFKNISYFNNAGVMPEDLARYFNTEVNSFIVSARNSKRSMFLSIKAETWLNNHIVSGTDSRKLHEVAELYIEKQFELSELNISVEELSDYYALPSQLLIKEIKRLIHIKTNAQKSVQGFSFSNSESEIKMLVTNYNKNETIDNSLPILRDPDNPTKSLTLQAEGLNNYKDLDKLTVTNWGDLRNVFQNMKQSDVKIVKNNLIKKFKNQIRNETRLAARMTKRMETKPSKHTDAKGEIINLGDGVVNPQETIVERFTILGPYAGTFRTRESFDSTRSLDRQIGSRHSNDSFHQANMKSGTAGSASHSWFGSSEKRVVDGLNSGNILRNINTGKLGDSSRIADNNVAAVRFGKNIIFYVTTKDVKPGEEYFVDYGDGYNPYYAINQAREEEWVAQLYLANNQHLEELKITPENVASNYGISKRNLGKVIKGLRENKLTSEELQRKSLNWLNEHEPPSTSSDTVSKIDTIAILYLTHQTEAESWGVTPEIMANHYDIPTKELMERIKTIKLPLGSNLLSNRARLWFEQNPIPGEVIIKSEPIDS
ncbi:hypothetical protein [Cedecea sp.]|jgi:hypothetical protein|uniref:hypothetical protein n=1 Tax=Cedecea sp. TaxID=1970739 RepID=UPI002F4173B5